MDLYIRDARRPSASRQAVRSEILLKSFRVRSDTTYVYYPVGFLFRLGDPGFEYFPCDSDFSSHSIRAINDGLLNTAVHGFPSDPLASPAGLFEKARTYLFPVYYRLPRRSAVHHANSSIYLRQAELRQRNTANRNVA